MTPSQTQLENKMLQSSSEIVSTIIQSKFTNDELNTIIEAVKFARSRIAQQNTFSIRVGAKVQFKSSKTGLMIEGVVEKVNPKTIIVRTAPFEKWKVSASLLTLVG
jgi:uncharacterized protein YkvS